MRPFDARLVRNVVSLCLPTAAVLLGCVYFFVFHVPDIIRNERRRVLAEYREYARELKADPSVGFKCLRGKSGAWVKDRRMAPGYWGVVEGAKSDCPSVGEIEPGMALVWYADDRDVCHARLVSRIKEVDFRMIFLFCGSLLLVVLTGVTLVGVRFFIRYARERDDFVAATVHDLTTPLVGLKLTLGGDVEEARNLVERMLLLVANLKAFLLLGGKRPEPKRERVDLVAAYASAYRIFRSDYRDLFDGSDVECAGAEGLPHVCADETLVLQALWNLLGNDLKYAAPYGRVRVAFEDEGHFVSVTLHDEGPGMTPRQRRHAFDRYYRAAGALRSGKGGFGIGLSTAREFVRSMGGELTVEPSGPRGSAFRMRLPKWT